MIYPSFTVALMATLLDINHGGPDHHADPFTISVVMHEAGNDVYTATGPGWSFTITRLAPESWQVG